MELVIKIPEDVYTRLFDNDIQDNEIAVDDVCEIARSIRKGKSLPKGHGDLIDVNRKITISIYDEQDEKWGEETLTVLEILNSWSNEGVTMKDVIIQADEGESEDM